MNHAVITEIIERIETLCREKSRLLLGIAGPPGAGKSTICAELVDTLNADDPARCALLPMDGYHYDNAVLEPRGLLPRKGAPETFNASGLLSDLRCVREGKEDVAVAVFDREADLSRANARIIATDQPVVLVEGNYLLLDRPVWRDIAALFDVTVMIHVDEAELERRLVQRWLDHGLDPDGARRRARGNDLANAKTVLTESIAADIVVASD